jgi:hypothetical protein
MILRSAGLRKVIDPVQADIVICNTCSVRQKGEDRVFGFIHEIEKYHNKTPLSRGDGDSQGGLISGNQEQKPSITS